MKSLFLFLTLLISSGICVAQDDFIDGVDLTTNTAPWTMRILGNDLNIVSVQSKEDERSAYFMMASASTAINVSVFIEPVDKCKSGEECRDHVLGLGNPAWGKYEQLAKGKLKDFSYFEFYRPEVEGDPLKMLDMYAEYVSQGYWVDLHISKTEYTKVDHALLEKVVNSISFVPASAPKTDFDLQAAKAQTTFSSWLNLWESGKCKETFAALSSLSRQSVKETQWTDYCTRLNKDFGANRTRKPIAIAVSHSLLKTTDRPFAVLAYRSSFANKPAVVEYASLLLDQKNSWIVHSYFLR